MDSSIAFNMNFTDASTMRPRSGIITKTFNPCHQDDRAGFFKWLKFLFNPGYPEIEDEVHDPYIAEVEKAWRDFEKGSNHNAWSSRG